MASNQEGDLRLPQSLFHSCCIQQFFSRPIFLHLKVSHTAHALTLFRLAQHTKIWVGVLKVQMLREIHLSNWIVACSIENFKWVLGFLECEMWTSCVPRATFKEEEKNVWVAFFLLVKRKSLFSAAAFVSEDLENPGKHLCQYDLKAWQKATRYCCQHCGIAHLLLYTGDVHTKFGHWWPWGYDDGPLCLSNVSVSKREPLKINIIDLKKWTFHTHSRMCSLPPNKVYVRSVRHSCWPSQLSYSDVMIAEIGHQMVHYCCYLLDALHDRHCPSTIPHFFL